MVGRGKRSNLAAPDASQRSLLESRTSSVCNEQAFLEQKSTLHRAKGFIETSSARDRDMQQSELEIIRAMMKLMGPARKGKDAEGTKKQRE